MSLRNVQRRAASRYSELGSDLSASLRPQRTKHRTSDLTTTTRLLRNSRLFSLPQPLSRPSNRAQGGARTGNDPSLATLPYPTHAAVTTPPSSFARGDWGLKRSLPSKAFNTSTPVIRINANDTIDHITDFESASDHVLTLRKWQEMNIPITTPRTRAAGRAVSNDRPLSAFEDSQDPKNLPLEFKESNGTRPRGWGVGEAGQTSMTASVPVRRWQYDAPWIAGMQVGEFEEYVRSSIKKRRVEFRDWLRKRLATQHKQPSSSGLSAMNIDQGLDNKSTGNIDATADNIVDNIIDSEAMSAQASDDTLSEDILQLRSRQRELMEHVWAFLDLPGRFPDPNLDLHTKLDLDQGPPSTHPSAGLSYSRPVNWLHNHPMLGPMSNAPPVQARVLQGNQTGNQGTVLGVGGVAVDRSNYRGTNGKETSPQAIKAKGGAKTWVQADQARIDSKGRINLSISRASQESPWAWGFANGSEEPSEQAMSVSSQGRGAGSMRRPLRQSSGWTNGDASSSAGVGSISPTLRTPFKKVPDMTTSSSKPTAQNGRLGLDELMQDLPGKKDE